MSIKVSIALGGIVLILGCSNPQPSEDMRMPHKMLSDTQVRKDNPMKVITLFGGMTMSVPQHWEKSESQGSYILKPLCKGEFFLPEYGSKYYTH